MTTKGDVFDHIVAASVLSIWERERDLNTRLSGYEPDLLPLKYPAE